MAALKEKRFETDGFFSFEDGPIRGSSYVGAVPLAKSVAEMNAFVGEFGDDASLVAAMVAGGGGTEDIIAPETGTETILTVAQSGSSFTTAAMTPEGDDYSVVLPAATAGLKYRITNSGNYQRVVVTPDGSDDFVFPDEIVEVDPIKLKHKAHVELVCLTDGHWTAATAMGQIELIDSDETFFANGPFENAAIPGKNVISRRNSLNDGTGAQTFLPGFESVADSDYSEVHGRLARSHIDTQIAHAAYQLNSPYDTPGSSQRSSIVGMGFTNGAGLSPMRISGTQFHIPIEEDRVIRFEMAFVAKNLKATSECKSWVIKCLVRGGHSGSGPVLVGFSKQVEFSSTGAINAWDVVLSVSSAPDLLKIEFQGEAAKDIGWAMDGRTAEVYGYQAP